MAYYHMILCERLFYKTPERDDTMTTRPSPKGELAKFSSIDDKMSVCYMLDLRSGTVVRWELQSVVIDEIPNEIMSETWGDPKPADRVVAESLRQLFKDRMIDACANP